MAEGLHGLWRARRALAGALCVMLVLLTLCALGAELRLPEQGDRKIGSGKITLDISHADQGYVMLKHSGTNKRVKARVSSGGRQQTYNLRADDVYEVFPLPYGSGEYTIYVFIQASGTSYSQEFAKSIRVTMEDENSPFLYPNQYCWYDAESEAVAKAAELCEGLETDAQKVKAVYQFITWQLNYDYIKALTVKLDYLPDVDETLSSGLGICFDYASLLACMLRSQGIPTKLVIGTVAPRNLSHAWNSAYVDGEWVHLDATYDSQGYKESAYTQDRMM